MKLRPVIILLILFFSSAIYTSYADDFSDAIIKAKKDFKTASNKGDQAELIKVRGEFERILQLKKNTWLVNYYMANVDLVLSNTARASKDNEIFKKYTESAIKLLDKSTDEKDDFADAYILKMAVNSNRWMYEPEKMNDIIAKTNEASDRAKKLEPDNPRYYLIDGMTQYYTPESFGGGAAVAQPLFEKSCELFKTRKEKDETYPSWGNEMAEGMLALCYIKLDKMDDAKKCIDKALELNPDSGFINDVVKKQYDEALKK